MDLVREAARNNALWCDAVCRAHGQITEFTEDLWICLGTPPRFHSNATTLHQGAQFAIESLRPKGFKDGFFDIDGTQLGYRELFRAHWIALRDPEPAPLSLTWRRVSTDEELQTWEAGWAAGDPEAAQHPRQFPPSLLKTPDHAFLGGYRDDQLVAGCILNQTVPVVGLSNVFSLSEQNPWPDLAQLGQGYFPGLPIVGYERGEDLEQATEAGFARIGELRVWV
ncbi:MAG: hypothetical protein ACOYON_11280 [Fimbriimonas sp.]